jgi:glycosyltransferase involved in cell wall biosynthesis
VLYYDGMDLAITAFLNPSGISYVGQAFFGLFDKLGFRTVPVWIAPPEKVDFLDRKLAARMLECSGRQLTDSPLQFHTGLSHQIKLLKGYSGIVTSAIFEGNRLTPRHIEIFNQNDAILAPTRFCERICLSSGVPKNKVFYVPYPLNSDVWNTSVTPLLPRTNRFRFLYLNTWHERKGWDILLRAFWDEFSRDDPVELVLKSYLENTRTESMQSVISRYARTLNIDPSWRAPVTTIDRLISSEEMPSFMKSFDAYVSPHRSEGFGLNIWHAMSLGVPVICTDYGGNTDFTKDDTAWLVKPEKMSSPSSTECAKFPHLANMVWAEPDIAGLRKAMRDCFIEQKEAAKRAETGALVVRTNFSYEKVGMMVETALNRRLPGIWEQLAMERIFSGFSAPAQRYSSGKPIKLVEI